MKRLFLTLGALTLFAPAVSATELTGTLKTISERGSIKVGFRRAEPPMSFVSNKGDPAGYSIDLCKSIGGEVAKVLNRKDLTIEFVPVTSSNRFSSVADGSVDILCGATTKTLKRAETVDFTQLSFITGGALLSKADAAIDSPSQLQGKRVAVVRDTTTIEALKRAAAVSYVEAEIVPVVSAVQGMRLLKTGDVAAFASDQIVLIGMMRSIKKGKDSLHVSHELFSREPFALAVRRNDSDFRLVADRALSGLYRSGRIKAIYNKWFPGLKPPTLLRALYELHATPK